jgi:hypothetical protein
LDTSHADTVLQATVAGFLKKCADLLRRENQSVASIACARPGFVLRKSIDDDVDAGDTADSGDAE